MAKSERAKRHPQTTGSGKAGKKPKQQPDTPVVVQANKLREEGYTIRRNRVHAATPPKLE